MENLDVVIVGAGISGLTAARELTRAGRTAVILEKSRGVGGRAATRRVEGLPVDHGAQFFTARSEAFRAQVRRWEEEGRCFVWSRGFHRFGDSGLCPSDPGDHHPRYACAEGMTSLAKDLAEGLDVRREQTVAGITPTGDGYELQTLEGKTFAASAVFCSAPLPQALGLTNAWLDSATADLLAGIPVVPCFAVIAELKGPDPAWRGIQVTSGPLSWIGADFTKRSNPARRLIVLHAGPVFSRLRLTSDLPSVAEAMGKAAAAIDPATLSDLEVVHIHRWRFAKVSRTLEERAFLHPRPGIFFLGDSFLTGQVESAWRSGREAAAAFLRE